MPAVDSNAPEGVPHSLLDDVQGFLTGAVCLSLGVALLKSNGLLTGGTAGLAMLLSRLGDLPLGWSYWLLNLPFFALAWLRLGPRFTLKSLLAVSLLGLALDLMPRLVAFQAVEPLYAAVAGGLLSGVGAIAFIRHGASVGGINILAVYLQQTRGWRAGWLQLSVDLLILAAALALLAPLQVAYSITGAVALGVALALNHRPGRYMGF